MAEGRVSELEEKSVERKLKNWKEEKIEENEQNMQSNIYETEVPKEKENGEEKDIFEEWPNIS